METLQWTMLVGLLGMLLYVLWHRMRASFGKGVPPPVAADWEGEGALWSSGVVDIHLRVVRAGEVTLNVHMDDHNTLVHEGALEVGVHARSVAVPDGTESVTIRMACEGHRTERRLQLKG
jgi:hypothetical protein